MRIAGLQKLTLLDFPGRTAATVFTPGCNLRCPFCHNGELVTNAGRREQAEGMSMPAGGADMLAASRIIGGNPSTPSDAIDANGAIIPDIPLDDVLCFLRKRAGLLDGVCISGGEPLLQPGLADFCAQARALGYSVKLDTNGTLPDRLEALLDTGLVDAVALDVKNEPGRYAETVGLAEFDIAPVERSIKLLLYAGIPFEFRTTVVRELHSADSLTHLARWLAAFETESASEGFQDIRWFIQNFKESDTVLADKGSLHPWPEDDLRALVPELQTVFPGTRLRGVSDPPRMV